ncbi:MAG: glycosyltransferase [Beijerinckiaceae bacterium]|nr:glycosyltransferase [Beijerinckiaceae bacterium]
MVETTSCDVIIGVPTFKRPEYLTRCLKSLEAQTYGRPVRLVVADNDAEGRQGIAICERLVAEGYRFPLTTVIVSDRGIAPTRNAIVREAIADPAIAFIAMIDDDEWAEPDWLSELLAVQAEYDADVVGGPVGRVFQSAVPDYVAAANQPNYDKTLTGPIDLVDATSNILFRASLFREKPGPWFDLQYALMGCEDKDILLGYKLAGKRFAWAARALVTEEMPTSRCSAKWMIQRAYRVGNTDTLINLKHRPPGFNPLSEGVKIVGALGVSLVNLTLLGWSPARRFEGMRLGARVVGKFAALFGGRYQEYKVTHGN